MKTIIRGKFKVTIEFIDPILPTFIIEDFQRAEFDQEVHTLSIHNYDPTDMVTWRGMRKTVTFYNTP